MELTPKLAADPYTLIGEEDGVRRLVDRFYDLMDTLPEATVVRGLHPRSLHVAREKLFLFLTGWLGGPQLYVERYGHPRLRRRHFPFAIDQVGVDQWMLCMRRAIDETIEDAPLRAFLVSRLEPLAAHMRNQPG
ncbi:MAG: globin [Sandaracinus sp.]|nr:globin [Sandaracinus sp.]|tara:strand:- start:64 stop:465 length:402 start_codon:yes stop_codon:yes gene_type:complete